MRRLGGWFSRGARLCDLEVFYLTYDEPLKEQRWKSIISMIPHAVHVDGITGFDRAHKACAEKAHGKRFVIIDGDNVLLPGFLKERVADELTNSSYVLSWASVNSINGLEYGNGGVKCWDKEVALNMKTHENSDKSSAVTDFCFEVPYFLLPSSLSVTEVHLTPKQAFRAGFREGIKMSLKKGCPLTSMELKKGLDQVIPKGNFFRLMTWMSVGADSQNGVWAILGSRIGLFSLICAEISLERLQDYGWFDLYWNEEISPRFRGMDVQCPITKYSWSYSKVVEAIEDTGRRLYQQIKLEVPFYHPAYSKILKNSLPNPKRSGLMYEI